MEGQGAVTVIVIKSEEVTGRAPQEVVLQVLLLQHVLWVRKAMRSEWGVRAGPWAWLEDGSGQEGPQLPPEGGARTPVVALEAMGSTPSSLVFSCLTLSF